KGVGVFDKHDGFGIDRERLKLVGVFPAWKKAPKNRSVFELFVNPPDKRFSDLLDVMLCLVKNPKVKVAEKAGDCHSLGPGLNDTVAVKLKCPSCCAGNN